ncbi:MAG: PUA domain-containing protein [Candidatus Asgardarchaeum sp.]
MLKRQANIKDLMILNGTFNYQFQIRNTFVLFENVILGISKSTKKIRHIYINDKLIATIRPSDGFLIFNIEGAEYIKKKLKTLPKKVVVSKIVQQILKKSSIIPAKYIVDADQNIYPEDEVFIVDEENQILATGKAILTSYEMKNSRTGIAVKVRHKKK